MRSTGWMILTLALFLTLIGGPGATIADDLPSGLDHARLAAIRTAGSATISPDGQWIAFVQSVPRNPGVDDDGASWSQLHVVPFAGGEPRVYIGGEVNVSTPRFTPDSKETGAGAVVWCFLPDS